jgi:hypothetical protein
MLVVATLVVSSVALSRRPTEGRLTDGVGATPASTGAAPVTLSSAATPGRSPDAFHATVGPVPPALAAAMNGVSWRPGCPVPVSGLRLVQLTFWGFDNAPHQGKLVVHADVAQAIVRIFRKLYAARFPIRKMRLIDAYGGSDDRSMADDNTSMFNCRNAYGSTHWSMHAYGKAIDVNTVENPYLPGHAVLPAAGAAYLDRHNVRPGMIVGGDLVTQAFAAEGFRWGGYWTSGRDYQHFEIGP